MARPTVRSRSWVARGCPFVRPIGRAPVHFSEYLLIVVTGCIRYKPRLPLFEMQTPGAPLTGPWNAIMPLMQTLSEMP